MSTTRTAALLTDSERRFTNISLVGLPALALVINGLIPSGMPELTAVITAAWLVLTFAPLRFSIPSAGFLNFYRSRLALRGSRVPTELVLAFSPASQLRAGYWLNVATTLAAAAFTAHAYLA